MTEHLSRLCRPGATATPTNGCDASAARCAGGLDFAAALMIGTFELMRCIEVPYKVAINEAVELAKSFGGTDGHKYVNGVLDKAAAELRRSEVDAARASRG